MKSMNKNRALVLSLVSLISISSAVQAVRFVPSMDQIKNAVYKVTVAPVKGAYNVVRHPITTTKDVANFSAKFVPSMSSVKDIAYRVTVSPFVGFYNAVRHPVDTGSAVLRGGKTAVTTLASPFTRLWSYAFPSANTFLDRALEVKTEIKTETEK